MVMSSIATLPYSLLQLSPYKNPLSSSIISVDHQQQGHYIHSSVDNDKQYQWTRDTSAVIDRYIIMSFMFTYGTSYEGPADYDSCRRPPIDYQTPDCPYKHYSKLDIAWPGKVVTIAKESQETEAGDHSAYTDPGTGCPGGSACKFINNGHTEETCSTHQCGDTADTLTYVSHKTLKHWCNGDMLLCSVISGIGVREKSKERIKNCTKEAV